VLKIYIAPHDTGTLVSAPNVEFATRNGESQAEVTRSPETPLDAAISSHNPAHVAI
jgi:hypothetical protein